MSLNHKQRRFVAEYLKDSNATQAAIRAGYSKKTAYSVGGRLLKHAEVQRALNGHLEKIEEKAGFTAAEILREIGRVAMVDVTKAFGPDGRLLPLDKIPEEVRRCIAGIEYEDLYEGRGADKEKVGDLVKLKFWDKNKGLEMAGRHLKLFVDRVQIENVDELAHRLNAARARSGR